MHEFSEQIYEVMGWSLDAEFLPDLTTPEGFAELQKAEEWLEKKLGKIVNYRASDKRIKENQWNASWILEVDILPTDDPIEVINLVNSTELLARCECWLKVWEWWQENKPKEKE